ncbi:armadillo repeat-containing protein 8 isoform X6 [Octopus bimaculoides]|uniref:armadillo repeat-containing protein 8 isoform X6 n=1 Tax=Octopus bimaculoides TaxID=37653 RepID=UPI00071D2089|nr:armadillo repeat-containing protein 8 isoform X6 [Octopus bimaculoides]|eukprot:XP_014791202.1 PREDICTED: armadillo repeat-containing protein 8-like isoform X6 [Octopus bimaculoides]
MSSCLMEVDGSQSFVEVLLSNDSERWMDSIVQVKNMVIGNNKQKSQVIVQGLIPRLLQWMMHDNIPLDLKIECSVVLGSLSKGTEANIVSLIEAGSVPILLAGNRLANYDLKYVEACLRCLRTVFLCNSAPKEHIFEDSSIIPLLINVLPKSSCTQECVTTIFANCCKTPEHQNMLCSNGAIEALAPLLKCNIYKVQMPTLRCFSVMCYQNEDVAQAIANYDNGKGDTISEMLVRLRNRDKTSEMQMAAAKCLTYLYRGGALMANDPIIMLKTLPTLIRMCKKDRTLEENVEGAETLAYLIEVNSELQKVASISDHLIRTLSDYLKYTSVQQISSTQNTQKKDIHWGNELKQAAFKAFASLGANDEDIRKKIIETENLIDHITNGMESSDVKVQAAAVRCLHSLSRSVQQLRTTFQDHALWKPLLKMLQNGPEEVLRVASSTLCNLMLEFSPSKEVSELAKHIDNVMNGYGDQIMQAVVFILEGEHCVDIKEQALCILGHIADGKTAKDFIVGNEDVLRKLINYMVHNNEKVQLAAVYCICNLVWNDDEGSAERQARLRDLGVQKSLQQLSTTTTGDLQQRVKLALQQFS